MFINIITYHVYKFNYNSPNVSVDISPNHNTLVQRPKKLIELQFISMIFVQYTRGPRVYWQNNRKIKMEISTGKHIAEWCAKRVCHSKPAA